MEADSPAAEGRTSEGEASGDSSERKQESRDEMLTRHRREIAGLQNKELALKKAAAKGSKAEQKAKKKQVEDEMIGLSSRLKAKHSEELASLGYKNTDNTNEKGNLDNLVKAIAGVTVTNGGNSHGGYSSSSSKPSKGAKRRERRAQEEAAREQRIQEEQSNIVSDRMIENKKLEEKLVPLGLTVNEIKPDGHCLYRAVEDQLLLLLSLNNEDRKAARYSYLELRKMAADYMREHAADLLPFFLSSDKVEVDSDECDSELLDRFKEYCEEVESTAAWGGQLELGALSHCLKKHIMIYSGSYPDVVEMGREYFYDSDSAAAGGGGGGGGGSASRHGSIMLSYHMHAYGLGEHYNSVVPNLSNR